MLADFILHDADVLYTCQGPAPKRGAEQRDARPIERASIASLQGRIVFIGPAELCDREVETVTGATRLSAKGHTVVPGFVDPHTHLIFAGDRRAELQQRLAGATYADIAAAGGGIVKTVASTRAADEAALVADARPRLAAMLASGTTTAEIKSGYGLDVESELRMLRAIRTLGETQPVELVATFLGAHEIPKEYRDRRSAYVRLVIDEMLPRVAREGLAEWCDVFCDVGFFTPEESRAILEAGRRHGLGARIHADELALSGGAIVAADVGARSADHLIFVDDHQAEAMARAGVIATLLPAAAFFLKLGRFAPARRLIEHGVAVALATDLNPGGGFSPSMPFVMTLAAFGMDLTLEEALVGATINAAASIDRHDRVGSLEVGKQMDAVLIDGTLADLVRVGAPVIACVIKNGALVATSGTLSTLGTLGTAGTAGTLGTLGTRYLMSRFADLSVERFLVALASSDPTPGGGTASAIAGSMGASLLMMVSGLAKSRNNTDAEREVLATARGAIADLRESLLSLADDDASAFDLVMGAFKLPKGTDEEKAARTAAIQESYRGATEVPLDTLRLVTSALAHAETVAAHGNRSATSDVGVAIGLLEAAAAGATANVQINVGSLKDQALVTRFNEEVVGLNTAAARSAAAARAHLAQ